MRPLQVYLKFKLNCFVCSIGRTPVHTHTHGDKSFHGSTNWIFSLLFTYCVRCVGICDEAGIIREGRTSAASCYRVSVPTCSVVGTVRAEHAFFKLPILRYQEVLNYSPLCVLWNYLIRRACRQILCGFYGIVWWHFRGQVSTD